MTRLGIVTGMRFEAGILTEALAAAGRPEGVTVVCAGPGYKAARRAAETLLEQGHDALLSFGIAGGLVEGLRPGTLLLADQVVHWSDTIDADPGWMARLREGLGAAVRTERGNIAHSDPPAATPSDKRMLHIQTRALGVDMESFAVGEAAKARGTPFLALRAVADGAKLMLPVSALEAMNPDGTVDTRRALTALGLHPWEVGDLIRLGLQTARARRTLRDLARLGLPRLFFV
jgi:adenosylhomocysteine nucleosidase